MEIKSALVWPVFVFQRRSHVELEADFILAGQLVVGIPKSRELKQQDLHLIGAIIQQLAGQARAGLMPSNCIAYGWRGGTRPPNAVDTDNDELMSAWANRSLVIALRIPSQGSEDLCIDSDMLAQMRLLKHDA